jgi:hypothetical protein
VSTGLQCLGSKRGTRLTVLSDPLRFFPAPPRAAPGGGSWRPQVLVRLSYCEVDDDDAWDLLRPLDAKPVKGVGLKLRETPKKVAPSQRQKRFLKTKGFVGPFFLTGGGVQRVTKPKIMVPSTETGPVQCSSAAPCTR